MANGNKDTGKHEPSKPTIFEKAGREVKPARYESPPPPPKQPDKK